MEKVLIDNKIDYHSYLLDDLLDEPVKAEPEADPEET